LYPEQVNRWRQAAQDGGPQGDLWGPSSDARRSGQRQQGRRWWSKRRIGRRTMTFLRPAAAMDWR
jgi:hypothetical protein